MLLRKIPSDTLPNKMQLWLGEKLATLTANLTTVTREFSNIWTLTFKSEDDAHKAWVALQDVTFEGEKVLAEIRSDTLLRSFHTNNVRVVDEDPKKPKLITIDDLQLDLKRTKKAAKAYTKTEMVEIYKEMTKFALNDD